MNEQTEKHCLGDRCPMQYDKVNPFTCRAVNYCVFATPYTDQAIQVARAMLVAAFSAKPLSNEISARREPDIVVVNGNPVVRCKNYQAGGCMLHSTTCLCPDYSPIENREP